MNNGTTRNNLETFEKRLTNACPQYLIDQLAQNHGFCQRRWLKLSPILFVHALCHGTLNALHSLIIIARTIAAISGDIASDGIKLIA